MKKLLLVPLLFTPAIIALIFEYFFADFGNYRLQNFSENILFGILFFSISSLIKPGPYRGKFFLIATIIYTILIWIETVFYYLYNINFNASSIYVLLESSSSDIEDFFVSKFDLLLVGFSLAIFTPLFFIIPFLSKKFKRFSWFLRPSNFKRTLTAIVTSVFIVFVFKWTKLGSQNLPYLLSKTSSQYKKKVDYINNQDLTDKIGYFKNSIRESKNLKETFVIVIGESHTRQKMSIYGYHRTTNPKLESIKEELTIFDKVISSSTSSNKALSNSFTYYIDSLKTKKASIIQLFNSVGFKTYWLSNQAPLADNSFISEMVKAADETKFINILNPDKSTPYDMELLKPFNDALKDSYTKKVIFIHLLGNHQDYNKRYPKEFQAFQNKDTKHPDIETIIDYYDNATVYNDYVINTIINDLRKIDGSSFMLYFSNHGEDVYETTDSFGHSEEEPTKPMYDIPFILWSSEGFKKDRPFRYRPYRKYMTDNLLHSIAHLANIKFKGYDASKSVFSIYYKNRPRLIQGDVNYDKLYE